MDLTSSRWFLIQPKVAASLFGSLRKAKPSNDNLIWPDQPPLNRCQPLHQASAKPNADGRSQPPKRKTTNSSGSDQGGSDHTPQGTAA